MKTISENKNTIDTTLRYGAQLLAETNIETAHLDARILLCNRMQIGAAQLIAENDNLVADEIYKDFAADITRRQNGEPVAYIIGKREFMGLEFICAPTALMPRVETEELTTAALAHIATTAPRRVLDLGCGSGAIGLSIAHFRSKSEVLLADKSEDALALAKQNGQKLQINNAQFYQSDWWQNIRGMFDCIVANPPYICQDDEALSVLKHEPRMALCGGKDGMRDIRLIVSDAPKHLRGGGVLLIEHGAKQQHAARECFAAAGFCGTRCLQDLSGNPRITFGVLPSKV
ncbi:MAG: peptide chain release factor N(5)-glutamine methyltransferase [Gammaproteobacteria bacterium WSBS_2016_MAG_OTU1]